MSKIPLRNIADLFTHLDPGVKANLQSAFAEAEDLMNFHNNSSIGTQTKRVLSADVAAPILTSTTNNRGFDIQWQRLDDRRISFYDVQVSLASNFANPDDYKVVDTCFSLEGVGTTIYTRVRGVKSNGDCGPWSDSKQIDAFATTAGPVVYTRGFDAIPSFYINSPLLAFPGDIQHITITPERQNGGIVVFGSIAVENPSFSPGDFIKVKLNSTTMTNIPLDSLIGFDRPFSMGFGPVFLTHTEFGFSVADDVFPATVSQTGAGAGTHTGWTNTANVTGTMETDYSGATATDYLQSGLLVPQALGSKGLKLSNFGFTVPGANTITGIEMTFTGGWFGGNPAKSAPQISLLSLLDETGTPRSFSQSSSFPWPGTGLFDLASQPASGTIPSVTFGGTTDLWGESAGFWTPAKINDVDFGVEVFARLRRRADDIAGDQRVWIYGVTMTVYSINADFTARVDVIYNEASGSGVLLGCTLNAVEFGSALT
jgi:hypothetical protein